MVNKNESKEEESMIIYNGICLRDAANKRWMVCVVLEKSKPAKDPRTFGLGYFDVNSGTIEWEYGFGFDNWRYVRT